MSRKYWMMKSEPSKYPFAQLVRDGRTRWDGVRNYEARNSMRAMEVGDLVLFYHSNDGKDIVGVARVKRESYADPTAPGEDWSVVDIEPLAPLRAPVSLDAIRSEPSLAEIALLKKPRISVVPVSKEHFDRILKLGRTRLAGEKASAARQARASSAAPAAQAAPKQATKAAPKQARKVAPKRAAPKATKRTTKRAKRSARAS
jgi:predicted RNA-binding protein with PUA-like domain